MPCYYTEHDEELSKSWFHKLSVLTQRDSGPVSTSLCFGCDSLDLPGIVARMRTDSYMGNVALPPWTNSVGLPMNEGACALCAMFSANWNREGMIRITSMESIYFGATVKFFSWSRAGVVFYNSDLVATAVFEIIPSHDDHLDPMSRLLDPSSIDSDRIQLWLQSCSNADLAPQPRQKTDYLPGFRLVNCRSHEITKPPQECRYVALSYVWGEGSSEESQSQRFPQTIEDAIRVCLKLGFEYIWIDRYCIDQSNYEDKHAQISQMDVIYSEASLVIVAAAGDDPTYGLPGVSAQARTPQQSIKLKDCILLQTFPEVHHELKASAWINRGWTLQEGYFGTRKLIFTAYQVIYICKHGHCNESVSPRIPWDIGPLEWRLADEHERGRRRTRSWLECYFSFEEDQSQKTRLLTGKTKCEMLLSRSHSMLYGLLKVEKGGKHPGTISHSALEITWGLQQST